MIGRRAARWLVKRLGRMVAALPLVLQEIAPSPGPVFRECPLMPGLYHPLRLFHGRGSTAASRRPCSLRRCAASTPRALDGRGRFGHQPELGQHLNLVEIEVLLYDFAVTDAEHLEAATGEAAIRRRDVATWPAERVLMCPIERESLHAPLAVIDLVVDGA